MATASEDISKPMKSPSLSSIEDEKRQRKNERAVMINDFKRVYL